MKKIISILVFFIFVLIINTVSTAEGSLCDSCVKVDGIDFKLDGKNFYFAGANSYYLWYSPESNVREVFSDAQGLNLTVIRTWGFADGYNYYGSLQPSAGVYSEPNFQKLDKMIKLAKDYNIKLIIPLVNNWDDFGGMCQYAEWCNLPNATQCRADEPYPFSTPTETHDLFYTDSCTKNLYKNYVNYVLNRVNTLTGVKYQDDSTIFAWELANEPRARSDKTGAILDNWIADMSAYIKSIDSNHLVTSGGDGGYKDKESNPEWSWWYHGNEGQDFIANHMHNSIDFATFRYYPEPGKFDDVNPDIWIKEHIEDAHNIIKKPVIIEEFGSKTDRPVKFSSYYNLMENNKINGDLYWMIADEHAGGNDGYFISCPEESVCSIILQHANYMKSLIGSCNSDDDCSYLSKDSCSEDSVKHEIGKCVNSQCQTLSTTENCDDGLFCNGRETCFNGACSAGTSVNCSANNLTGIDACSYSPDDNPFTNDFFAGFTSSCEEQNARCSTSLLNLTHTCNKSRCNAECETGADCNDSNPATKDSCSGCKCVHEDTGCVIPTDAMNITQNTILCEGEYHLPSGLVVRSGVTLDCNNALIYGDGTSGSSAGLDVYSSSTIKNCRIEQYNRAIELEEIFNAVVKGNTIRSNNMGIYIWHGDNLTIENNLLGYNSYAVYTHNVRQSRFANNTITFTGTGFRIWYSNHNLFENNTFVGNNRQGEAFFFDWHSSLNNFTGNKIYDSYAGFYHPSTYTGTNYECVFTNNDLINNNYGFLMGSTFNSTFLGNNLINNNYGFVNYNYFTGLGDWGYILPDSYTNLIYHNNFINNVKQAESSNDNNSWSDNGEGNYWSNYDAETEGCLDSNSNGICDLPYSINLYGKDEYPFQERNGWKLPYDTNDDCKVNILDLIFIRNKLNQDVNLRDNWKADVTQDNKINILDLIAVRSHLNTSCK